MLALVQLYERIVLALGTSVFASMWTKSAAPMGLFVAVYCVRSMKRGQFYISPGQSLL
jgi:hypothetical protein